MTIDQIIDQLPTDEQMVTYVYKSNVLTDFFAHYAPDITKEQLRYYDYRAFFKKALRYAHQLAAGEGGEKKRPIGDVLDDWHKEYWKTNSQSTWESTAGDAYYSIRLQPKGAPVDQLIKDLDSTGEPYKLTITKSND